MGQAHGHLQEASVPCLVGLSTWLSEFPHNMAAASPKSSDPEKGKEQGENQSAFYDPSVSSPTIMSALFC